MKILAIENDESTVQNIVLAVNMRWPGSSIFRCKSATEAIRTIRDEPPDVIILDSFLPNLKGLDVLPKLRKATNAPILYISAIHDEAEVLNVFERGGDDYMNIPLRPLELLARLEKLRKIQRV